MGEAVVPHSMSFDSESVHPAIILGNPRDDDPTTILLRHDALADLDDIVNDLHRYDRTSPSTTSSTVPTNSVFSSRRGSVTTKPTSKGTSYPIEYNKGKEKAVVTYASSLSATHGSGSDTEREVARDDALAGLGHWAGVSQTRTPKRKQIRPPRPKKPVVIVHGGRKSTDNDRETSVREVSRRTGRTAKYLRCRSKLSDDQLTLAEEGRLSQASTPHLRSSSARLSRGRLRTLVLLVIAIVLTFSISVWGAHRTGRSHLPSTKVIIFSSTVAIAFLTVCTMMTARRSLEEALLTGLLELVIGFALVVEVGEFM